MIFAVLLLVLCCHRRKRQQALTWDQVKAKFEAANPALKADQSNVDELKAEEITAYLRPNPEFTLSADGTQIAPHEGYWRPTSGTQVQPNFSYLHERDHKRELRLETREGVNAHRRLAARGPGAQHALQPALRLCADAGGQGGAGAGARPTWTTTTRSSTSARTASRPATWRRSIWTASNCCACSMSRRSRRQSSTCARRRSQLLQLLDDRTPVDQFDVTGPFDFASDLKPLDDFRAGGAGFASRPAAPRSRESSRRRRTTSWQLQTARPIRPLARGTPTTHRSTIRMPSRRSASA